MKKIIYLLVLWITGACLCVSCNSDVESTSDKHYMQMYMVGEKYNGHVPFPCTVMDYDDWAIVRFTTDGMKETKVLPFLCVHKTEDLSFLILGYDDCVVLAEYDLLKASLGEHAVFMSSDGEYNKYTFVKIGFDIDGTPISYTPYTEMVTEAENDSRRKVQSYSGYTDDFMSETALLLHKHLSEFDSKVSNMVDFVGEFGKLKGVQLEPVKSALSAAITVAKMGLLDIPGVNEEAKEVIRNDIGETVTLGLFSGPVDKAYSFTKQIFEKTVSGAKWLGKNKDVVNNYITKSKEELEQEEEEFPMFSGRQVDLVSIERNTYGCQPPKYIVKLRLDNVGETTAKVYASYTFGFDAQMSFVSDMGIECWNTSTGEKTTTPWNNIGYVTLENLESLTNYTCCAYMKSFGETYRSNFVDFTTNGNLTLHPSSLQFPEQGGYKDVEFSVRRELISSWSFSAPNWCKVEKYDDWFRVNVEPNTKTSPLSGDITINMQLKSGKQTKATLPVTQDKATNHETSSGGWDGTSWSFSNGSKYDFSISITNVKEQEGTFGGFLDESRWDEVYIAREENGEVYIEGITFTFTKYEEVSVRLVRTSKNTAKAYLEYTYTPMSSGNSTTYTATLNGTLQ